MISARKENGMRPLPELLRAYEELLTGDPKDRERFIAAESSFLRILGIYAHSIVHYSTGNDTSDMDDLRHAVRQQLEQFMKAMEES